MAFHNMASSFLVYLLSVWCSASALVYGDKKDSGNLRSSVATGVAQRAGAKKVNSTTYFLLERVGFMDTGPAKQPNSPHVSSAECLTVAANTKDRKGGVPLGWTECQDLTTVASAAEIDAGLREQQLFALKEGGLLEDKHGRCLRRVPCDTEDQPGGPGGPPPGFLYDLYDCEQMDEKYQVKLKVEKAQANSVDHMRDMGWLRNAVEMDNCNLCGPYRLQNQCMTGMCGENWQAYPGWTKLASQYVGDQAVYGHSTYGIPGPQLGNANQKEQLMGIDMSGIGYTKQPSGICGSWVTDSPAMDSYFYVLKDDSGEEGL
jgi:hypothetical protein